MYGLKLSALYTLQHGLTRDAEYAHCIDERNVSLRNFSGKARPEFVRDPNTPRRTWRQLLADNEAVVQAAMEC